MLHEHKSEEGPWRDRRHCGIPFHPVPASVIYGRMKLPFSYKALLQLETTAPREIKWWNCSFQGWIHRHLKWSKMNTATKIKELAHGFSNWGRRAWVKITTTVDHIFKCCTDRRYWQKEQKVKPGEGGWDTGKALPWTLTHCFSEHPGTENVITNARTEVIVQLFWSRKTNIKFSNTKNTTSSWVTLNYRIKWCTAQAFYSDLRMTNW